jgi:hypothetical protein
MVLPQLLIAVVAVVVEVTMHLIAHHMVLLAQAVAV